MVIISSLTAGAAIRILQNFRDCAGGEFTAGQILHFKKRDFLPYHGGHTVFFEEATMYLCDNDETGRIVQNVGGEYFALA